VPTEAKGSSGGGGEEAFGEDAAGGGEGEAGGEVEVGVEEGEVEEEVLPGVGGQRDGVRLASREWISASWYLRASMTVLAGASMTIVIGGLALLRPWRR
jgi:hypothetical protein